MTSKIQQSASILYEALDAYKKVLEESFNAKEHSECYPLKRAAVTHMFMETEKTITDIIKTNLSVCSVFGFQVGIMEYVKSVVEVVMTGTNTGNSNVN